MVVWTAQILSEIGLLQMIYIVYWHIFFAYVVGRLQIWQKVAPITTETRDQRGRYSLTVIFCIQDSS